MLRILLLLIPAIALAQTDNSSGGGGDGPAPAPSGLINEGEGMVAPANYKIQPSDVLYLQVFQHPDLEKEARVEADGTIALHLVGRVNVQDLTVSEAREKITELYNRDYLVNPQVDLQVVQFNLDKVQVLGQVRQPGLIGIQPDEDLTLLSAISQAGGFTRLARKGTVRVRRTLEDGEVRVIVIDASDLITDPDSEDFVLQGGDIIFIDERLI